MQDGHYDLVGPDEEIILPKLWEASVKPNWGIKMAMWPMHNDEGVPPPPDPPEDNALTGAMNPGGEGTSSKKKGKKPAASPSGPSPPTPPPEIDFHFSPGELSALPGGGKIPRPPGFPDFPPPPKSLPKAAQRRRRVVRRTGRNRRKNDGSVRTADSSLRTADSTNDDEELMQETKSGVRGWFSNWGSKNFNSVHKKG